jgi:YVTN family beta-propeller protein
MTMKANHQRRPVQAAHNRRASLSVFSLVTLCVVGLTFPATGVAQFKAYVPNALSNNVSVIDTVTNTVVATIPVGNDPRGVTVTSDSALVYVQVSGSISVIHTFTDTVEATIPGTGFGEPAVTPDRASLYIANLDAVRVFDTATNSLIATVPVATNRRGIVITPDGTSVYASNRDASNGPEVAVIDTATNTVATGIPVTVSPGRMTITPDGSSIYLADRQFSDTISVIDTATDSEIATVTITAGVIEYIAFSPDGATAYATDEFHDSVLVIDTATRTVTTTIAVGDAPSGVDVTPDGAFVYVTNQGDDTVTVIDTSDNSVVTTVDVGRVPTARGEFIVTDTMGLADADLDGVLDIDDNCGAIFNTDQADLDGDGEGDVCDDDIDGDGVVNADDAFPFDPNESADSDEDTIPDGADNCPADFNPEQTDTDGDGTGDECDSDIDGDGLANDADNCPTMANADQADGDGDGIGDICDLLDTSPIPPATFRVYGQAEDATCELIVPLQVPSFEDSDTDTDGVISPEEASVTEGHFSVADENRDGSLDEGEYRKLRAGSKCINRSPKPSCRVNAESRTLKVDSGSGGIVCFAFSNADQDVDGVLDVDDNCAGIFNPDQTDTDGDGYGDACQDAPDRDFVFPAIPVLFPEGKTIRSGAAIGRLINRFELEAPASLPASDTLTVQVATEIAWDGILMPLRGIPPTFAQMTATLQVRDLSTGQVVASNTFLFERSSGLTDLTAGPFFSCNFDPEEDVGVGCSIKNPFDVLLSVNNSSGADLTAELLRDREYAIEVEAKCELTNNYGIDGFFVTGFLSGCYFGARQTVGLNKLAGDFADALFDGFTIAPITVAVGPDVVAQIADLRSRFDFTGFFPPIANLPTVNAVKAGGTVPVKFSLNGDQGLDIFADGFPVSQEVSCDSELPSTEVEETGTAGSSGLSYDADIDQYIYRWKTEKSWAGTCRQLIMKLSDDTEHVALFEFK